MSNNSDSQPDFWTMEPIYINGQRVAARHEIRVDKHRYQMNFKDETEDAVTIVLEPLINGES